MLTITKRNLKLFFRDKGSVIFSLLAVFIVIGLYVLFLGDNMIKNLGDVEGAKSLMSSWVMAGILAVTSVTTTLGALGVMVDDRSEKILKDFSVSPIKRWKLVGGYITSAFSVGLIMSLITFALAQAYIISSGGEFLSFINVIKIIGLIFLSVFASSSMVFFIVSLFKTHSAFTTASTIIGTLIGFLTGVYIPIGSLSPTIQFIIKIFPVSHASSLFRQVFMEQPMAVTFMGAPIDVVNSFKLNMGVVYEFGNYQTDIGASIIVLLLTSIIFFGLSVLNVSKKSA